VTTRSRELDRLCSPTVVAGDRRRSAEESEEKDCLLPLLLWVLRRGMAMSKRLEEAFMLTFTLMLLVAVAVVLTMLCEVKDAAM